jgi:hypothetical protein
MIFKEKPRKEQKLLARFRWQTPPPRHRHSASSAFGGCGSFANHCAPEARIPAFERSGRQEEALLFHQARMEGAPSAVQSARSFLRSNNASDNRISSWPGILKNRFKPAYPLDNKDLRQ